MATFDLGPADCERVLAPGGVVRVAFRDGDQPYLIPLGFVWLDGGLAGVLAPGRKTRLAEADPNVVFQVDTSARTGVFAWSSVLGRGRFEIVDDARARRAILEAFEPVTASAPAWWRDEHLTGATTGALSAWRIAPDRLEGRRCGPGDGER